MGWYGTNLRSKQDLINELNKDIPSSSTLIQSSTVGNHYWQLFERKDNGERWISLSLLSVYDGLWGYKSICDSSFPYYYTCPIGMIKKAGQSACETANKWRETVLQHHEEKKARKKLLVAGLLLRLGSSDYKLLYKSKNSWVVEQMGTGTHMLMSPKYVNEATVLPMTA